jgi:hypothetical protein
MFGLFLNSLSHLLKNRWWPPVTQLIHSLLYYHHHVNQGPDQQASLRQQCQAVHYDHCPGLLIFQTHLSADRPPNLVALNAVRNLIQCGVNNGSIARNYRLYCHRNVGSTTCPGPSFCHVIMSWPNYAGPRSVVEEPVTYVQQGIVEDAAP